MEGSNGILHVVLKDEMNVRRKENLMKKQNKKIYSNCKWYVEVEGKRSMPVLNKNNEYVSD